MTNQVVKTRKRTHFPYQKNIRLAPLQEAVIEYMVKKYGGIKYRDDSDYVRQAIMHEAKNNLPNDEFEWVCGKIFNDHEPETTGKK